MDARVRWHDVVRRLTPVSSTGRAMSGLPATLPTTPPPRYGAEGRIRTGTGIAPQRFLRPPRLPFRHFGIGAIIYPCKAALPHPPRPKPLSNIHRRVEQPPHRRNHNGGCAERSPHFVECSPDRAGLARNPQASTGAPGASVLPYRRRRRPGL